MEAQIKVALIGGILAILVTLISIFSSSQFPVFHDETTKKLDDLTTQVAMLNEKVSRLEKGLASSESNVIFSNRSSSNLSDQDLIDLRSDLLNLRFQVVHLNQSLNKMSSNPDISYFNKNYMPMNTRLSAIENAIMDSPERSLALYKLSNEMETMKEDYESDLDYTRSDIDRVYNIFIGFMAAIVALSLGLIGLAWSIWRKSES
jgi:hypothetical protein